jgi:FAD/FMN-containing dehydrogenase/N-acetylneuraminic acid mutarotase
MGVYTFLFMLSVLSLPEETAEKNPSVLNDTLLPETAEKNPSVLNDTLLPETAEKNPSVLNDTSFVATTVAPSTKTGGFSTTRRIHSGNLPLKSATFPNESVISKQEATVQEQIIAQVSVVTSQSEIDHLSPPVSAHEGFSIQLDDEIMIYVGGYTQNYNNVTNLIQFFNITSQSWLQQNYLQIPPNTAGETHAGYAWDPVTRHLYMVAGQVGPGCSSATSAVVRIHVDTGDWKSLPPLPQPRYTSGAQLVEVSQHEKYLHVFGGASSLRSDRATHHWRLPIVYDDQQEQNKQEWEELAPLPDGGTHGSSFQHNGYIYYTAFSVLDQGLLQNRSMAECQRFATLTTHQVIHHFNDFGLMFRFHAAANNPNQEWERVADLLFPNCHAQGLVAMGRFILIGGGRATKQTRKGSLPVNVPKIQIYNPSTDVWESVTHFDLPRGKYSQFKAVSWNGEGQQILAVRPNNSAVKVRLVQAITSDNVSLETTHRREFAKVVQETTLTGITKCMNLQGCGRKAGMEYWTIGEEGYDDVRGTWNRRLFDRQFPHLVAFPNSTEQVSCLIVCARRSGYRVCGRNGRHSFEGDTCTNGVVVDVKRLSSLEVVQDGGWVRSGAGMYLGRLALLLSAYNLTLPMGHCASVGLTGLVLVGGQGLLSRLYGMTSDFVESIELVDDQGKIINATQRNEYSDFLWMARGGGSSVLHFPGIITAIQFKNLPRIIVDEPIWTKVELNFNATIDNAVKLLSGWEALHLDKEFVSDPLSSRVTAEPWLWLNRVRKHHYVPALNLLIYFFGRNNEHEVFMKRIMPKFSSLLETKVSSQVQRLDDLAFHRMLGGVRSNRGLASGVHGWDLKEMKSGRMMNRWKAYSAVSYNKTPAVAFRSLAESIFHGKPFSRRYVEFKPLGGAVGRLDRDTTAFWHRDALWWSLSSHWYMSTDSEKYVQDMLQSSRQGHESFVSAMGNSYIRGYAGYIDHSNSTGRDLKRYYGGHASRILAIKRKRDPTNLFMNSLPRDSIWATSFKQKKN